MRFLLKNKKAQSTIEYALIFAAFIAAVVLMSSYYRRAFNAKLKRSSTNLNAVFQNINDATAGPSSSPGYTPPAHQPPPDMPSFGGTIDEGLLNQGNDLVNQGMELYNRGQDLIKEGEDLIKQGQDLLDSGGDPAQADELIRQGEEKVAEGQDLTNQGIELINQGTALINQGRG